MPSTFQAVAVVIVALLPGALYIWAFERIAGRWGIGLSDRIVRFLGISALLHVAVAPLSYWLWSEYWPRLREGVPVPWTLWGLLAAYVVMPFATGTVIGLATKDGRRWSRWFTGPDPAPRAWGHLFQGHPEGWVRLRMKSGAWIGGAFTQAMHRRSYTAGYPEQQDLYIAQAADLDPDTGEFLTHQDGSVQLRPSGLLVRWDEVEYLEFIDG